MNIGKIVEISGPVVDVFFENGPLPKIKEALKVKVGNETRIMEVASHIGQKIVRCIMLAPSENLSREMEVYADGKIIEVPVGNCTLGRMFNVLGQPIDGKEEISALETRWPIH